MKVRIAIVALTCAILLSACDVPWEQSHPGSLPDGAYADPQGDAPADATATPQPQHATVARVSARGDESVDVKWGSAVAEMGMALYGPLQKANRTKNLCYSPASICWTLTQAAEGCAADARLRILEVLRLQDVPTEWMQAFTHDAIATYLSGASGLDYAAHDAIWVQQDLAVSEDYADMARASFGSDIQALALKTEGVAALNAWLRSHTLGSAADAVTSRKLTDKPLIALSGAAMLRTALQVPIEAQNTLSEAFVTATGRDVRVPMMAYNGPLPYYEDDTAQTARLPLGDGRYGLTIVLPKAQRKDLLSDMDLGTLRDMWRHLEVRSVDLRLPRFTIDARVELSDALAKLGMADAFDDEKASFSQMLVKPKGAALAGIWHGASIVVSESQSDGAAQAEALRAQEAQDDGRSAVALRLDRPFFYAVDDSESGALLMLGVVADPRGAEP